MWRLTERAGKSCAALETLSSLPKNLQGKAAERLVGVSLFLGEKELFETGYGFGKPSKSLLRLH